MEKTLRQLRLMLAAGLCMALAACSMQDKPTVHTTDKGTRWHWDGGTIVVETPPRPEGQQNVLGLTAPRLEVVRVGFVGLGMRGDGAVRRFTYIPGTQVVALCDYERGRAEQCQEFLRQAGMPDAAVYSGAKGYEELCRREDIDLVYVAADWLHHYPVARCAMDNGCAPVAVPDFTRGHWNDRQGYSHAYAAPADEQEAARKAADFTRRLTGK